MTPRRNIRAEARALLVLGLPLIGSNIAQFVMHLTDAIMLGWYDVEALAAATLAGNFFFVVFLLGAGFAWAVMPMVAEAAERDDRTAARRVTRMGIWLSVAYGLLMMMPLFFAEAIFLAIGQEEIVARLGEDYLRIVGWQLVPALVVIVLRSFLSALERTAVLLWITLGTAALNVPLNWLLIFGNLGAPEMGIRGAAVASLSLAILSLVALVVYVMRVSPEFDLFRRIWRIDSEALVRVFRIGLPIGFTSLAEGGLFTASSVMMGWLGAVALAAHGVALQLTSLIFMIHVGLSQAATVRAGRALGRRDEPGLRTTAVTSFWISGVVAGLTVLLFLLAPEPLIAIFVDPDDPARGEIMAIGIVLLAAAAVFQFVDSAQVIALGLLRGLQDTRVPMYMATVSYWLIGLPVSYVFGFVLDWGGAGVWAGLAVGLGAAALSMSWRFWSRTVRIGLPGEAVPV